MSEIRDAIKNDTFYELKERVYKEYGIEDGKDFKMKKMIFLF